MPSRSRLSRPVQLANTPLLISSRDQLAVCIKPVEGAVLDTSRAKNNVQAVLEEIMVLPYWKLSGLDRITARVDAGCSEQPSILGPNVTVSVGATRSFISIPGPRVPKVASEYVVILFVLPQEIMERFFRSTELPSQAIYRREAEEQTCDGDQCFVITVGFYLTPKEIEDAEFVRQVLPDIVGFKSSNASVETPSTGHDDRIVPKPGPPRD